MQLKNHYRKEIVISKEFYDNTVKKRMKKHKIDHFATYVKRLITMDNNQ